LTVCPNGTCSVHPHCQHSDPSQVDIRTRLARAARCMSGNEVLTMKNDAMTLTDIRETAEDYRELIHRCDLQIWQILEVKELAENKLRVLEGET
jgi:hypothetical protein